MTNKALAMLGTLALVTAASAFGQTMLTADVPFEFTFAHKVMPAGHYDVFSTPTLLRLRGDAAGNDALSTTYPIGSATSESPEPRLVFHKYGDKYFLAEVWCDPGDSYSAGVLESKEERELAGNGKKTASATVPARTDVVLLARLK